MTSGYQFRPDGPPALDSAEYAAQLNQVKELGNINSTTRTAEQTEIAKFWADGPGFPTRLGEWLVIVRLEKFIPAKLDNRMRQQLLTELFATWLQEQLNQLGSVRPLGS